MAQTLLTREPLKLFEGQQNSYVSPAQEELQLIGAKSLLGIALRSSVGTHGVVILQQCDYRRAWTKNEIDMVQNVAVREVAQLHGGTISVDNMRDIEGKVTGVAASLTLPMV
ncbi:MAG: hypothetical protein QG599_2530 [Pseudomonadota bacterium]|nr:hypothetical protein [Pseudomonadota bacterium]